MFYRSYTPVPVYSHPPTPMRPPQQIPYERPSFPQKHHNKHPHVEPFSTFHNAPSRVWPPVPAFSRQEARLPPCALTSTPMADSSPRGQAPTPMSRSRMSTRSVGSTHRPRMDSGVSSPEPQMRPSHVRRQDSGRSVFTSSQSGSEDSVRFSPFQLRILADGLRTGALYTSLTTHSAFSPLGRPFIQDEFHGQAFATPSTHPAFTQCLLPPQKLSVSFSLSRLTTSLSTGI